MRSTTPSTFPSHPAKRATVLLTVRDHTHHRSLMIELLQRARRAKLSGVTVFEAQEGYGESGRIHRTHLLSDDAPVTVVFIDRPDRIDGFLREVEPLLDDVLVIVDDIDVVGL
jgi:PII-like signaling protein